MAEGQELLGAFPSVQRRVRGGRWAADGDALELMQPDAERHGRERGVHGLDRHDGRKCSSALLHLLPKLKEAAAAQNAWRTTGDIQGTMESVLSNLDDNNAMAAVAKPGNWNNPDM